MERFLLDDTIDYFHGDLLDINGWDLRKTLNLLSKSNATPFEWAQSPIVYEEEPGFCEKLLGFARQYFQPRYSLNHYRGIAKNSFSQLKDGQIKLKKLFYVIRPVLAAQWIVQKGTVPPMDIHNLMSILDDAAFKQKLRELIVLKSKAEESYLTTIDPYVKDYLEEQLRQLDDAELKTNHSVADLTPLDEYFRMVISTD
ncbi:MAG: nucleotidyltransferase domain-containing protein [Bacteroidota bacterium]